eukprot:scaffold2181_cov164-Skeletonema_marinoi.AAC.4
MQSNDDHQDEEEQQIGTASSAPIITTGNGDLHDSTPMRHQQQMEEEAEATNNVEAPNTTTTPKVTKLQVSSGDDDDFNFDAWGEDEIDITEDTNNKDDSDETAERMRLESQKLAQQIMEEEQKRIEGEERLRAEEEEKQRQLEAERIKREKMLQEEEMERQRLRKLEEEEEARRLKEQQQRLEQEQRERQAAEEAQAAEEKRLKKLREEEERLRLEEETKFIEAQKRMELERRQAQEEAQAADEQRLREEEEQERLRLKEEAAAEDEANRLEEEKVQAEKERLLQEEEEQERLRLEEEQRLLEEQKRLESEREAQKGAAAEEKERREEEERDRLRLEEEAKLLEVKRLEEQRQADEDARIAEKERQRMIKKEEEEREQERLRVEEDVNRSQEQQRLEQEAVELVESEDSVLADEINDEIGDDAWSDQSEEIEGDDEIFSSESADRQAQSHTEVDENSEIVSVVIDAPYTVEHADANALNDHEVSQPNNESLELQDSLPPIDAQGYRDNKSDVNVVQQNNTASSAEKPPDNTFFGAAAADLASSMFENQATNLFNEASKSASMFSWGKSSAEDDATPPASAATNVEAETEDEPNSEDGLYNDDDLDAMYDDDDDESDDSETHDETDSQKLGTVQNGDNGETLGIKLEMECRMPSTSAQHTVEDFVKQLERMSESHQLEMNEMQRSHQLEMEALQHELSLERDKKEKDKARKEVASQDKFLSQMRELEKKFNTDLKEKDDELQKVMQRNEGMRLKMDSIKREVDGLIKLVDERDDEIATLKQGHGKSMVQVEGKVKYSEEALARKDAKISELNASVSSLQADLDSTTEAYHTLKERAKSVATELKDRRVEVRTLTSQNQELSSSKTLQETQLVNLRAVVNQHELTIGYKDKDMDALNTKVKELEKQIEGKEKSIQDSSAVGEKAISSYKRKAQEALAAANSRLALSNQAREEAESEAKAAKSTSDDAVTRARDAELKMSEAEQRANAATSLLDELKLSSSGEINELNDTVDNLRSTIDTMQKEAKEDSNERERLNVEMGHLKTNLVEVKKKESELREKLIEQQALCTSLQKEVHDLNDEVQRNSAAAFKRANDEEAHSNNFAERNSSVLSMDANGSSKARDREEADGTIIMLQQELYGANEAIADLKLALRTALLEKTDGDSRDNIPGRNNEVFAGDSPHGNDSTPLFYAIEKQNELNTARDEINRLANMLGDAEAEKQEAYDIMEDMRHKMEDANARLLRYEKLGMKGARPHQHVSQSSYGPFRNTSQSSGITSDNNLSSSGNDSVVNLEYLKNVMLSYLKAKTLADRRKLVPVIATVLCLTPEEQAQAVNSVEDSAGLSGVAVSFWENLGELTIHDILCEF